MRDRLQSWLNNIIERWKTLTKRQKISIASIAGGVLLALALTLVFAFRTNWTTAFTIRSAADAAAVENALGDAGINSRVNIAQGIVEVPQGQVDAAWMAVEMSEAAMSRDFTFEMALDHVGMGMSANMTHEMMIRTRETEVANALMRLNDINFASVELHIPDVPSFLIQSPIPSTAGIIIGSNRVLIPQDGENIAVLVSRMVRGLTPDGITVMDTNMNMLFTNGEQTEGSAGGGLSPELMLETHWRQSTERLAQNALAPHFHAVTSSAHVYINWERIERDLMEYFSPYGDGQGLIDWEEYAASAGFTVDDAVGGVPGLDSQGFGGPQFGDMGAGAASMQSEERRTQFLQNFARTAIRSGNLPGQFIHDNSSVSVSVTNFIEYNEATLRETGVIADDTSFAAFRAQVGTGETIIPENAESLISHVSMATGIPAERISILQMNHHEFIGMETTPLPILDILLWVLALIFVALMGFLLIRRATPEVIDEIEPELSVEDLLVSSQLDDAKAAEIERLAEIQYSGDSQVKEQIDKFAEESPENVAQLLRNWINEDWE